MLNSKPYTKKKPSDKNNSNPLGSASYGLPAPTEENIMIRQTQIDEMKLFFATAPHQWETNKFIKRFHLPNGESISCVLWDNVFFISGTDIVRSLTFRFHAFGRPVINPKKFEEGIFSDLRNLKPGHDARLEDPKSELLDILYKNNCIRTQKKQKVFYWFSVPHDRLFLDALERDLKREKMGLESTTRAIAEPAASLSLDSTQELFDELRKSMSLVKTPLTNSLSMNQVTPKNDDPWPTRLTIKRSRVNSVPASLGQQQKHQLAAHREYRLKSTEKDYLEPISSAVNQLDINRSSRSLDLKKQKAIFGSLSLFDGSPAYKQRRRRTVSSTQSSPSLHSAGGPDRVRRHDKCHHPTPAPSSINFSRVPSFGNPPPRKSTNSGQSRLAMAAYKAGLTQTLPSATLHEYHHHHQHQMDWRSSSSTSSTATTATASVDFYPSPCQQHLEPVHMFTCHLCGKCFAQSENLEEHHRLEHSTDMNTSITAMIDDKDDDDDDSHIKDNNHYSSFIIHQDYPHASNSTTSTQDSFFHSPPGKSNLTGTTTTTTTTMTTTTTTTTTTTRKAIKAGHVHDTGTSPEPVTSWPTLTLDEKPFIDIDFQMQDVTNRDDCLFSVYNNNNNNHKHDCMYNPIISSTSSINSLTHEENDASSSLASSPTDPFHSMTLFSPFKPIFQEQEEQQQQQFSFDDYYYYAPYTMDAYYHHHLYTPLNDMNFVFSA